VALRLARSVRAPRGWSLRLQLAARELEAGAEAIAHAGLGEQVAGPLRTGLQLAPQARHVDVQNAASTGARWRTI